jgi:hypothetical protein
MPTPSFVAELGGQLAVAVGGVVLVGVVLVGVHAALLVLLPAGAEAILK